MNASEDVKDIHHSQISVSNVPLSADIPMPQNTILTSSHPSYYLFAQNCIYLTQRLELKNVLANWDQPNRYRIQNEKGEVIGFIEEVGGSALYRNTFKHRRALKAHVLNADRQVILKIRRPRYYFTSNIYITTEDDVLIGEVAQKFHFRRKYKLYDADESQFAKIDTYCTSWDFTLKNENEEPLGCIDREFTNVVDEIFTNKGLYSLRFDTGSGPGLTLDQRAVTLACAISIDFDHFSEERGDGQFLHGAMKKK